MTDSDGSTRERGRAVEQFVSRYLSSRGVSTLERNYEAAGAEVDLVCRVDDDGEPMIVFVEIRSRSEDERGSPLETVGPDKQRRVIRAATAWLVANDLWEKIAVRFDVVGVVGSGPDDFEVDWIQNAFEVDG